MTDRELGWVAGIVEGEGWIGGKWERPRLDGTRRWSATIKVRMTDEDVIRRLHTACGVGRVTGPSIEKPGRKPTWAWQVQAQADAIGLVFMLFPLMGVRRQEQIRLTVRRWRESSTTHPQYRGRWDRRAA